MTRGTVRLNISTYRAGMLQSQAYRALSIFLTDALKPYGISMPAWAALGILHDSGTMRLKELAEALLVQPPVATEMIRDLEAKGLIERVPYPADKRVTLLTLSPKGTRLVEKIESELRHSMHGFLGDIPIAELVIYLRVTKRLAAKL